MNRGKSSIYWKLLISFLAVIISTSVLSAWTQYQVFRQHLPQLLTKLYTESTAREIESYYNEAGTWENISRDSFKKITYRSSKHENIALRVIIKDKQDKTLFNSFFNMKQPKDIPLIRGNTEPVFDYMTGKQTGSVIVYLNRIYLENETKHYLLRIAGPGLMLLSITAILSSVIAAILSRKISAPVSALTVAAKQICSEGRYEFLTKKSDDELGEMTNSFNNMITALKTQQSLRKRLIQDVAHEIHTPLNLIRFEAKGLLDGITSSREAANKIIEDIDNLKDLIHDLNWLAESDSGLYRLSMQKQEFTSLLSDAIVRWKQTAGRKEISLLLIHNSNKPIEIMIDRSRIRQVIDNLIENSVKNTPPGGSITISWTEMKGSVITSICDTGTGIADEDLPFIFDRFYRSSTAMTSRISGKGLGLQIAKRIIQLHGGRIYAENREEKGSCFIFSLPLPSR